jgi:hypothetical protein
VSEIVREFDPVPVETPPVQPTSPSQERRPLINGTSAAFGRQLLNRSLNNAHRKSTASIRQKSLNTSTNSGSGNETEKANGTRLN